MARRGARSKPAGQVLEEVRRTLESGWPPGLTLLTGDDLYHLDRAQRALIDGLVPGEASDFGLTVFGEERVDVGTVVSAARSVGMFAERRVVLVREVSALEGEPDALQDYAKAKLQDSFLIVRGPAIDRRRKLHKALAQLGVTCEFARSDGDARRLTADVQSMATERGLRLARPAIEFLAMASAGDLYRVDAELEKLRSYCGGARQTITLESVREVAAGGEALTGWELGDALLARDRTRALALARRILDGGAHPLEVLGGLAYRVRSLVAAKAMVTAGRNQMDAIADTRSWMFKERLIEGLERYSLPEVIRFPGMLLEADRAMKSRAIDPRWVVESLVDRITEAR